MTKSKKRKQRTAATASKPLRVPNARWLGLVVFLLAAGLYLNTLGNEFVWDDRVLIVENPRVQTLDGESWHDIFTTHFWDRTENVGGLYRPLVTLSYYVDYRLYGGAASGFHFTNLWLNAVACTLVLVLLVLLTRDRLAAFMGAVLFATLPLHTENVAWVAGRTDLMAAVFVLLSLVLVVRGRASGRRWMLGAALGSFVLALMSKEIAAVTPALVAAVGLAPRAAGVEVPRSRTDWLWLPLIFAAVMGLFLVVRVSVLGIGLVVYQQWTTGITGTLSLALATLARYCVKLLYPFSLNAEYEPGVPEHWFHPHVLAGIMVVVGLTWTMMRFRQNRTVWLAVAFFIIPLLPVLNFIPTTEIAAERFLFLPSLGFALGVSALVAPLVRRLLQNGAGAGAGAIVAGVAVLGLVVAFGVRTIARNGDWQNEATLFGRTVEQGGDRARAQYNLASVYYREGDYQRAVVEYGKVLESDPDNAGVWSGLAGCYKALGETDVAIQHIQRAIAIEPGNHNYRNSLGTLCIQAGRLEDAAVAFEQSLEIKPDDPMARFNLALARYRQGDFQRAEPLFEALRFKDTHYVYAYYYLCVLAYKRGDVEAGRRNGQRFLTLHAIDDDHILHVRALLSGRAK